MSFLHQLLAASIQRFTGVAVELGNNPREYE